MPLHEAVYAGTFDLATNGHLWMVETAARVFDRLYVAVAMNHEKKGKHYFTSEERVEGMKRATAHIGNVFVVELPPRAVLVRFAKQLNAHFLVRGLRDSEDCRTERALRHMNAKLEPDIATWFLMPPKSLEEISSSTVKGIIDLDGWEEIIKDMIPPAIYNMVLSKSKQGLS